MRTVLRSDDGSTVALEPARWRGQPGPGDQQLLDQVIGPALDVGCGPGRHVLALARMGVPALGVDISPYAVTVARGRGAPVIQQCVFRPLPLPEAWRTVLLLDGNVGIGGCPTTLLRRVRQLLAPGGRALVEVDPPTTRSGRLLVRVERGPRRGPWFAWARVAASSLPSVAEAAGLGVVLIWQTEGRWFARLDRRFEDGAHHDRGHRRRQHVEVCAGCAGASHGVDAWADAISGGA